MYIEDLTINENFLSKHHIDQIYNAFVHYCNLEENRLSADRYKVLSKNLYSQQVLNYSIEEAKILEKFSAIDLNRDLTVDFQDFSKFVILNLKFLSCDLSKVRKQEKLNLPLSDAEIVNFHSIIRDILFPLDYNNPFYLSEKSRVLFNNFTPFFTSFYNKYGELKIPDPRAKLEFFSNNFNKIFPKENINTLNLLLCSEDGNNNYSGVLELNDIVKCLDLLQNHYEILFYFSEIFNFLEVIINNQILDYLINLFFKYNVEANAKFFTRILKIFRRLYAAFIKIDELLQTCKDYDIKLNFSFSVENLYNLFSKFEDFYIAKIISNLDFLQNKSNNYYYLNQIVLLGLEFAKRSKKNILIFFESYNYLEILYANINYLVNSENYSFTIYTDKDSLNPNISSGLIDNSQSQSGNRANLNSENQKQGFLDINTLVNGKASDSKYLINSNTINANNKNCENFHFYQIRKIMLFCIKLAQITLGFKLQSKDKADTELELPIAKLRYILEITTQFFHETNDSLVHESFFILKTMLINEDVNLEFDFLNSSIDKIIANPNNVYFYNLLVKACLKNAKKALQMNSILNARYINILKELIFSESSESKSFLTSNNIENNAISPIDSGNFTVLNLNLFKDFIEFFYILDSIATEKTQMKDLIFLNLSSLAFDVFEEIFTNDSLMKAKLETLVETGGSKYSNLNSNKTIFLLNHQMLKIVLELIELLMQTENNFTILALLKKNFVDFICSNLDLFLSKNRFYAEALKNDANSGNENFDLVIIQKALNIFSEIIDSEYAQIKLEFFIKFFNFDFLTIMKQAFDYFYAIYKSKVKDDGSSNANWIVFYKFYQIIENDKFSSFLHQMFSIIFKLLTIFDEFVFSLYIKKTNSGYNFDTSHIEYFNPESQMNKSFLIKFSKYNTFKSQLNNVQNLNVIKFDNISNTKINSNSKNDFENEINYLNIERIMSQKSSFNALFLSRFICQNYNFREVCSLSEDIFIEFDTKITEIFSENSLLKGLGSSKLKQSSLLSFGPNQTSNVLNQSFINLPSSGSIRNIRLILQTPEERMESKAQILKIDNILNYSFLRLKNEIKILYSEDYDIYNFSHSKSLKIQINSTEDFIAALKEEKDYNATLSNVQKHQVIKTSGQSLNNISNFVGNLSKTECSNLNFSGEFEMHLYLEKSSKELSNKEGNLTVCPCCYIQHKISNEFYKKFSETKSEYYLMCRKCREYTFLKFIGLLTNIRSCVNLEQELFNLFPNPPLSKSQLQQSFTANPVNPSQMSNLDVSGSFAAQPHFQSNLSRQQNSNININRANLQSGGNLNSVSKNDFNYNPNSDASFNNNMLQSKGNPNFLASVGRNNTLNFSGNTNFPMSNYSSINNNNLISNLNNMNIESINPQKPNTNLLNTVSRNNLISPNPNIINSISNNNNSINFGNNPNQLLNLSNRNLNLNNNFSNKSKGEYNLLNPRSNRAPPYSGDPIQINDDFLDDNRNINNNNNTNKINNNASNSERIQNFNSVNLNSGNNNIGFSNKMINVNNNNSDSGRLNNISEFNLGNQIMPNSNNVSKRNANINLDENFNVKNKNLNAGDKNSILSSIHIQK